MAAATAMLFASLQAGAQVFMVNKSKTIFHSKARLELIRAESAKMRGAVDLTKMTFAFAIDINSFEGFNSPLQREHFNENYMESRKYPTATFSGRIIEDGDFTKNGTYNLRAKGKLTIHGVEQERIIQVNVVVKEKMMKLDSRFVVLLADHDIKIPKIVHEKLASEIQVDIDATLLLK